MSSISSEWIALAAKAGACEEALVWLRAQPRTMAELRQHNFKWYVWALSQPDAPPEYIQSLSLDSMADVRLRAVQHKNASTATLELAANDSEWFVRAAAISHPNATNAMRAGLPNNIVWHDFIPRSEAK